MCHHVHSSKLRISSSHSPYLSLTLTHTYLTPPHSLVSSSPRRHFSTKNQAYSNLHSFHLSLSLTSTNTRRLSYIYTRATCRINIILLRLRRTPEKIDISYTSYTVFLSSAPSSSSSSSSSRKLNRDTFRLLLLLLLV